MLIDKISFKFHFIFFVILFNFILKIYKIYFFVNIRGYLRVSRVFFIQVPMQVTRQVTSKFFCCGSGCG